MGRKPKYRDIFPLLAEGYAREGMNDKNIARKLGISRDTLYEYIKKYPDFSDSLKKGKAPVDFEVENALLKRAIGYEYEETMIEYGPAPKGKKAKVMKVRKITKQVAADVTADIFWLKNRKPEKWREKKEVDVKIKEMSIKEMMKALADFDKSEED